MEIASRLREARVALGKTQEQVAQESGMNVTQYNGYERSRSRPAPATLERIAAALQTTSAALRGELDPAPADRAAARSPGEAVRSLRDQFQAQLAAELGLSPQQITIRIEVL